MTRIVVLSLWNRSKFSYLIAGRASFTVVYFCGRMDVKAANLLQRCERELLAKSNTQHIILNFAQVTHFLEEIVPCLGHFQETLRAKPAQLFTCALPNEATKMLLPSGIIRKTELASTLAKAISAIKSSAA